MNKFKILITSYNNEEWTEMCLDSVLTQTHTNFEVLFFNDCSTDKTSEIAHAKLDGDNRFKIFDLPVNNKKSWVWANKIDEHIDDDDIVLFLDGDDWLSSDEVLNAINQYYELNEPWVAYGGMVVYLGGDTVTEPYPQNSEFPDYILNQRAFRQDTWRSSHTKTMRGFIWKSINKKDFISTQDGKYFFGADDLTIMFGALERCPKNKIGRFTFPTYVYNSSQNNVARLQDHVKQGFIHGYEPEVRSRKKYDVLPVITSELSGGIGNLMFQIAACVSLAKRLGYVAMFDPDKHFLPLQGRKFLTYRNNILRKVIINKDLPILHDYSSGKFNYVKFPNIQPFTIIRGGFQTEKYFDKEIINDLFGINDEISTTLINKYGNVTNKCSVHVRRGDYLKLYPNHIFVGEEYYTKSLDVMRSKGYDKFLVFGDDQEWCKSFFKGNEFEFISDEDYNEMYLMSLCGSNIIGNSTFSWWGAWLNHNQNKTVIAPNTWFGPGYKHLDISDIIPTEWIKI